MGRRADARTGLDGRRRRRCRRLGPDRVAGRERQSAGRSRHARARRGGDGRARLSPAPGGPRAAHRPHPDARRRRAHPRNGRQHPDARGGRRRRSRPRLRPRRGASPADRADAAAAFDHASRPGRRRCDRAERGDALARGAEPPRDARPRGASTPPPTSVSPSSNPTTRAARTPPRRTCSTLGQRPCGTSQARRAPTRRPNARRAGATALEEARDRRAAGRARRLERGIRPRRRAELAPRPGCVCRLRRERPDGPRPPARAARRGGRDVPGEVAWSGSTTWRMPRTTRRR